MRGNQTPERKRETFWATLSLNNFITFSPKLAVSKHGLVFKEPPKVAQSAKNRPIRPPWLQDLGFESSLHH